MNLSHRLFVRKFDMAGVAAERLLLLGAFILKQYDKGQVLYIFTNLCIHIMYA